MREVLLITIPIAPPWDEAKKNLALSLTCEASGFRPHLLTTRSYAPGHKNAVVWEPIYHRQGYGPFQKVSLLKRLAWRNDGVDVDHIFVDLSRRTAPIMRALKAWRKKPMVQTFATLPHHASLPEVMVGDYYIALSEHLAAQLRAAGAQHVTTVNPAVDLQRFDPSNVAPAPDEFGIPQGRKVVLYAGSFRTQADVDTVSSVIRAILNRAADVHFVVATRIRRPSERTLRDECLKKLPAAAVSDRVTVLETVAGMAKLLASCDICIYPAVDLRRKLDIPLVLLEALAMRKPVVCSDVGGMATLANRGVAISVAVGAWEQLAKVVLRLVHNQSEAAELAQQGWQMVTEHFSTSQFVKKHAEVYDKAL